MLVDKLERHSARYQGTRQEMPYLSGSGSCDIAPPDDIPVECKLLRYWRANGDSEDYKPKQVFNPFHGNTLLTKHRNLPVRDSSEAAGCSDYSTSDRTMTWNRSRIFLSGLLRSGWLTRQLAISSTGLILGLASVGLRSSAGYSIRYRHKEQQYRGKSTRNNQRLLFIQSDGF